MKTVLVVGSGAREHALAWKLGLSPQVSRVIVAPGNDGMGGEISRVALGISQAEDFEKLAAVSKSEKVDLVVVGPDNPLAAGITDTLKSRGLLCFGPSRLAARLESSKSFAKEIMHAARVPTAKHVVVEGAGEARKFLKSVPWKGGWVIKADGLALGKGVHVVSSFEEAEGALAKLALLSSADSFVIEERLFGEELSWMAFSDGARCALLEPARDYKRIGSGDQGPNTGGMGAFSPVPGIPERYYERVKNEIFIPVLAEMKKRGSPYQGLLYAGLMVDLKADRIWVIEFNARFGDPEAQVLLPRISGDLYEWCEAVAKGDLGLLPERVPFIRDAAVYVVAASHGYPDEPRRGDCIEGDLRAPEYFSAALVKKGDHFFTSGGRVFGALGVAPELKQARGLAYERMRLVRFDGMQFRPDIAELGP